MSFNLAAVVKVKSAFTSIHQLFQLCHISDKILLFTAAIYFPLFYLIAYLT